MTTPPRKVMFYGKEYEVNGCTGVFDFDFGPICDRHDCRYLIGGGPLARLIADILLWWEIVYMVGWKRGWLWVLPYFCLGFIYFCGVRVMGWAFWRWWWSCDCPSEPESPPRDK